MCCQICHNLLCVNIYMCVCSTLVTIATNSTLFKLKFLLVHYDTKNVHDLYTRILFVTYSDHAVTGRNVIFSLCGFL